MSGSFSADWLALREPFDRAARAGGPPPDFLAAHWRHGLAAGAPLQVVDLGSGTGANLREIAPHLGGCQHWRLIDHDPRLLAAVPDAMAPWAQQHGLQRDARGARLRYEGAALQIEIERIEADLSHGPEAVSLAGADLVTASALLDLASADWLDALVARCRAAGAAAWWALDVDGRIAWTPSASQDAAVHAAFRAHQLRDKGLHGPALGADAASRAAERFAAAGYRVSRAQTDWQVDGQRGPLDRAMLQAMVEGIGGAAIEQAPALAEPAARWQRDKLAQLDRLRLAVGHLDLWCWLA